MASDKIHNLRKAKRKRDLNRKKPTRNEFERILIVCEGSKTEPQYFTELVKHYRLNLTHVVIDGSCGSSPISVFTHAQTLEAEAIKSRKPFDKIYCVFDKDSHSSYATTVNNISHLAKKGVYHSITSVPCFEYWLLLHFKPSTKPYTRTGKKSAGDLANDDLKKHMASYQKGMQNTFLTLLPKLETAIRNAESSLKQAASAKTDNPTTEVHTLVKKLKK